VQSSEPSFQQLFDAAQRNEPRGTDRLFSALYSELRRLAKRELARQGSSFYLSPTTVLHEAYIEIADRDGRNFPDRGRFMAYAARVMRGLIIDHARSRSAQKRGGKFEITSSDGAISAPPDPQELTKISQALDELAQSEASLAEVVDLKFFCGFTFGEIAAMKGTSERTVQRQWEKARIYLHRAISADLET
jgi:RNA polymerase sigma factor (TIGR02999 family)